MFLHEYQQRKFNSEIPAIGAETLHLPINYATVPPRKAVP